MAVKTEEEIATYRNELQENKALSVSDRISMTVAFRHSADSEIFQQINETIELTDQDVSIEMQHYAILRY